MKIKVIRSSFCAGVALVKDVCEGKDKLNILRCVKIEAKDGRCILTASNIDVTVTTNIACAVVEPGAVALVGSSVFGFVDALPEGEVEIEVKDGASKAVITGGSCRYTVAVGEIDQWPTIAEVGKDAKPEEKSHICLREQTLKELFRKVKYAVSCDGSRRAIEGVNMSVTPEKTTLVGTDGRRLSFVEYETCAVGSTSVTLTMKTVKQLEKMIGKSESDIDISTDCRQIVFSSVSDGWILQAKLVDQPYPNWQRVIPAEKKNIAKIDRVAFIAELNRAGLSAGENRDVKFTLDKGVLTLEANDSDFSKAKTSLPVAYDGEKVVTDLNPALVLDVLNCVDDDKVVVAFADGHSPVAIWCQIPFMAVVMPLRIS